MDLVGLESERMVAQAKSAWSQQLSSMDHEYDDPGITRNQCARDREPQGMSRAEPML